MSRITLRGLIGPKKDAAPVVAALVQALGAPIAIEDAEGRLLAGAALPSVTDPKERHPVALDGQTLGWVSGGPQAEAVAALLAHLAGKESEKKTLGSEVLHLYREVNLIYNFSEKLAALLDVKAVARLTLEQARQLIAATDGAVMLLDGETQAFEPVAGFGAGLPCSGPYRWGEGLIGSIAASGNAEIVNDVRADPRCHNERVGSLLCAPLKVSERAVNPVVDRRGSEHRVEVRIAFRQVVRLKVRELLLDGSRYLRVERFDDLPRFLIIDLEKRSDLRC